jgi:serine/threonine protein kinase
MQVGDLFDGRYLITRILGQGGMGTVYLAQNINTGTFWAIKEIIQRDGADDGLPAEPKLLKKLEHPALPRLFDILAQDGRLYMVSDYIDGISLDKKLEAEGHIAEETVIEWGIQLCGALNYLHSLEPHPIIYRDMKPSNIILTGNGALKLIDFGIAREYKPRSGGDTVYIGTRGFAAPEQYGTGQTSAASDIYSLGITLHQLLTGKNPADSPYGIKPVRQFVEKLSPEIEAIIRKCTRENASERYQSAVFLQKELEALCPAQDKLQSITNQGNSRKVNQILQGELEKNPVVTKQQASFRKLVITVWDNAEFGCELAFMAAKHTKSEVLLADLDLLAPKADLFLNLRKFPAKLSQGGICGRSGLDLVMDALEKGGMEEEQLQQAIVERKDLKNLHVLTGNYRLENYEYYNEGSVPKLIEKCYRRFDITILLVNRSIYDAFTLAALLKSDMNIAALRGDVAELREFNSYIEFLMEKQHLFARRTQFVLFEYDKTMSIAQGEARDAVQGNLLGKISYSRRRLLHRNLNGAYAVRMEKNIEQEYVQLLIRMGLLPELKLLHKFRAAIG